LLEAELCKPAGDFCFGINCRRLGHGGHVVMRVPCGVVGSEPAAPTDPAATVST
jgi:hypothetical protein